MRSETLVHHRADTGHELPRGAPEAAAPPAGGNNPPVGRNDENRNRTKLEMIKKLEKLRKKK